MFSLHEAINMSITAFNVLSESFSELPSMRVVLRHPELAVGIIHEGILPSPILQ